MAVVVRRHSYTRLPIQLNIADLEFNSNLNSTDVDRVRFVLLPLGRPRFREGPGSTECSDASGWHTMGANVERNDVEASAGG